MLNASLNLRSCRVIPPVNAHTDDEYNSIYIYLRVHAANRVQAIQQFADHVCTETYG